MTLSPHHAQLERILGLAFASADLLFEIRPDGRVASLMGASRALLGGDESELQDWHWSVLFDSADHMLIQASLEALKAPGQRRTLEVHLASRPGQKVRRGRLSLSRVLQSSQNLSCALVLEPHAAPPPLRPGRGSGLLDAADFLDSLEAALERPDAASAPLDVDFLHLGGLDAGLAGVSAEAAETTRARIAGVLRAASPNGACAAQVSSDKYAVLRAEGVDPEALADRLARAAEQAGVEITAAAAGIRLDATEPDASLKALRHALERYISEGPDEAARDFAGVLKRTVEQRATFKSAVARRDFELVYQPVVSLGDRRVHHVEALARFEDGRSPGLAIRLAEDLDMIHDFDLAVAEAACADLAADHTLGGRGGGVAINLSGRSLTTPSVVDQLLKIIRGQARAGRILIEITETSVMGDLDLAERQVLRLRDLGVQVCLDDFGVGAASFEYLRRLTLDVVKIDGRFITNLNGAGRDRALLKHMVELCRALGLKTVAEMVETEAVADVVQALGVDYGQGWLFGRPKSAKSSGRRARYAELEADSHGSALVAAEADAGPVRISRRA